MSLFLVDLPGLKRQYCNMATLENSSYTEKLKLQSANEECWDSLSGEEKRLYGEYLLEARQKAGPSKMGGQEPLSPLEWASKSKLKSSLPWDDFADQIAIERAAQSGTFMKKPEK